MILQLAGPERFWEIRLHMRAHGSRMFLASMSPYFDAMSACSIVAPHRLGVDEFIRRVKGMSTSKAFRAMLELRENEIPVLQMWAARHCALHACFRSDRGTIVLVALRATPQTSASFGRTIRNALRRCGVPTSGLRGRWLSCITEREAISVAWALPSMPFPMRRIALTSSGAIAGALLHRGQRTTPMNE